MRKLILTGCGLLSLLWSVTTLAALERIGDFALLDNTGKFHQLSRYQHRKVVVLMSYVNSCDAMPALLAKYRDLQSNFDTGSVEFLLLDSLDIARTQLQNLELGFPLLEDDGQLVSETMGVTHAGEVLVLNPQRLSLFYRGPLDDELQTTVTNAVAGAIENSIVDQVNGCQISYPVKDLHASAPPDYASEVAPIIISNCAECHRQGGVGPFALDSYIMVLGWSPMIREVLLNKRMPPAQVDPYIGHSDEARYLSKQNLQTLIHWIDGGAPRGAGEEDPLETLAIPDNKKWLLGEPDYIVTAPENDVPRTGLMDYIYEDVELPFTEDKWLRAVQFRAGDESVLHHLMTFVTAPDEDFWGEERNQLSVTRRFVEGYAPGKPKATVFPVGTGVLIPKGHKLSMQFHYVTNGQSTVDVTELGLYFSDEPNLREILSQAVSARFVIPPNDPEFMLQSEHVFDEAIVLLGVRARMNGRGKKMKFVVQYADGSRQDIFSVPAYNYGWQPHYLLDQAITVPAGSTIKVIGAFDNSVSNPSNPDPSKEVGYGLESWDEMFAGYFTYYRQ